MSEKQTFRIRLEKHEKSEATEGARGVWDRTPEEMKEIFRTFLGKEYVE